MVTGFESDRLPYGSETKREPVFVEKAGQLDTVIISAEHYHALQANHDKASRAGRFSANFSYRLNIAQEVARK